MTTATLTPPARTSSRPRGEVAPAPAADRVSLPCVFSGYPEVLDARVSGPTRPSPSRSAANGSS
jgi:hypothetical protein